jgi:hypothetical protein
LETIDVQNGYHSSLEIFNARKRRWPKYEGDVRLESVNNIEKPLPFLMRDAVVTLLQSKPIPLLPYQGRRGRHGVSDFRSKPLQAANHLSASEAAAARNTTVERKHIDRKNVNVHCRPALKATVGLLFFDMIQKLLDPHTFARHRDDKRVVCRVQGISMT